MSISFTPFRNAVQLTTTKTSAAYSAKTSIADMTSTYYHGVLRQIRQSQDKLDANSRTIASDAHRAWKKKWAIKFKQSVQNIRIRHHSREEVGRGPTTFLRRAQMQIE